MSEEIFGAILPILAIAAIGYWLERAKVGLEPATLSAIVLNVGTPSLVFSALTSTDLPDSALVRVSLGAAVSVGLAALLALGLLRLLRMSPRTFLPPLTMPNAGNIGLGVVLLAFGEAGLAVGSAFLFAVALLQYTVSPVVVQGAFSLRQTLRQPLVWSVAAVVAVKLLGVTPPGVVADTTRILGGISIPVMLILLGGALARLSIGDIGLSVGLALARLVIGMMAGGLTVALFGLTGVEAGCLFLLSSMPAAIITYVFAARYNRSPEQVAGLILCSTLLSFAALPGLLWLALRLAAAPGGLLGL